MDTDDLEPAAKKAERKNLEVMSIEALAEYIGRLEDEISRAKAAIANKQTARNSADSAFKS